MQKCKPKATKPDSKSEQGNFVAVEAVQETASANFAAEEAHVPDDLEPQLEYLFAALDMSTKVSPDSAWYLDSGATCHMTPFRHVFTEYSLLQQPRCVKMGDNHSQNGVAVGTVHIQFPSGQVKGVRNVLHVPGLHKQLISVSKITFGGHHVHFYADTCQILDAQSNVLITGTRVGNLYKLNACFSQEASYSMTEDQSSYPLWHSRLGHPSSGLYKMLASKGLVPQFQCSDHSCTACLQGKITRSIFPPSGSRASQPPVLIHSDVCGPFSVPTPGGCKYMLLFLDDHTRKLFPYLLEQKSEVFSHFLIFHKHVERQTSHRLITLRTDGGGEFNSRLFHQYCAENGIHHELSVPYSPEQNGRIERANRTVIEMVRTLLLNMYVPIQFWGEAVFTAVYLINRLPHRGIDHAIPEEVWSSKNISFDHLRTFGCKAFVLLPKPDSKLSAQARECMFIGYFDTSKAYHFLDLHSRKLVIKAEPRLLLKTSMHTFINKIGGSSMYCGEATIY